MQTLNVFIDTCIFRGKSFDLKNETLQKLEELGREEKIYIYSTPITVGECVSHLKQMIDKEAQSINKLNLHLQNSSYQRIDLDKLKESRVERWKAFLASSKTEMIPIYNLGVDEVFDHYFNSKPPFGAAKEKKSEFPDAFVLSTLKNWCDEEEEKIYIVSSDELFLEYCDGAYFIQINSLENFLDLYNQANPDYYKFAESCYEQLNEEVKEEIKKDFQDRFFVMPEFWDADVEVNVKTIRLERPNFINIEPKLGKIDAEIDVDLSLEISFSYDDPDMTYWDSEIKEAVCLERTDGSENVTITVKVAIEIAFDETLDSSLATIQVIHLPRELEIHTYSQIAGWNNFTSMD